jgi:rubrerythrin
MNLVSKRKLPSSFNQLAMRIFNQNDDQINYSREWFCDTCIKAYKILDERTDRECPVCKSR